MNVYDKDRVKNIPILNIAEKLNINVRGTTAMCFKGHDRDTPSLKFYPKTNKWKCYGTCGRNGDNIQLVMEVIDGDFVTAMRWFEQVFGVRVITGGWAAPRKRERKQQIPINLSQKDGKPKEFERDAEIYEWLISKCGAVSQSVGISYLRSHGIDEACSTSFKLREICNPARALRELVRKWGSDRVFRSGIAGAIRVCQRLSFGTHMRYCFPSSRKEPSLTFKGDSFPGKPNI